MIQVRYFYLLHFRSSNHKTFSQVSMIIFLLQCCNLVAAHKIIKLHIYPQIFKFLVYIPLLSTRIKFEWNYSNFGFISCCVGKQGLFKVKARDIISHLRCCYHVPSMWFH